VLIALRFAKAQAKPLEKSRIEKLGLLLEQPGHEARLDEEEFLPEAENCPGCLEAILMAVANPPVQAVIREDVGVLLDQRMTVDDLVDIRVAYLIHCHALHRFSTHNPNWVVVSVEESLGETQRK